MGRGKRGAFLSLVGLLCFVLAGGLIRYFAGRWEGSSPTTVAGPAPSAPVSDPVPPAGAVPAPSEPDRWVVYVTGAVRFPGVYRLSPDSRACHLVEAAGGLSSRADMAAVNLAAPLADGVHLHVPDTDASSGSAGTGRRAGATSLPASRGSSRRSSPSWPVNLNRADRASLMSLPGVGVVLADRILEYRQREGAFRSVEELLKVRGIGSRKLGELRPLVTVR